MTLPVVRDAEVVLGTDAVGMGPVAGEEVRLAPNAGVLLRLRHVELAPDMREERSA